MVANTQGCFFRVLHWREASFHYTRVQRQKKIHGCNWILLVCRGNDWSNYINAWVEDWLIKRSNKWNKLFILSMTAHQTPPVTEGPILQLTPTSRVCGFQFPVQFDVARGRIDCWVFIRLVEGKIDEIHQLQQIGSYWFQNSPTNKHRLYLSYNEISEHNFINLIHYFYCHCYIFIHSVSYSFTKIFLVRSEYGRNFG